MMRSWRCTFQSARGMLHDIKTSADVAVSCTLLQTTEHYIWTFSLFIKIFNPDISQDSKLP